MSVLEDLAGELGVEPNVLAAQLRVGPADSIVPNYMTQDAQGRTGAQFSGKVKAAGIDLDGGPLGGALTALQALEWVRHTDGDVVASLTAVENTIGQRVAQLGTRSVGSGVAGQGSAVQVVSAPTVGQVVAMAGKSDGSPRPSALVLNDQSQSSFPQLATTQRVRFDFGVVNLAVPASASPSHALGATPSGVVATYGGAGQHQGTVMVAANATNVTLETWAAAGGTGTLEPVYWLAWLIG